MCLVFTASSSSVRVRHCIVLDRMAHKTLAEYHCLSTLAAVVSTVTLGGCRAALRRQALGDRKGISRFGNFSAPLDEALINVVLVRCPCRLRGLRRLCERWAVALRRA